LEGDADGIQMKEFGVGREMEKFDRLRQHQDGRRRDQGCAGERHDGADRASVRWLPVVILVGRRLLGLRVSADAGAADIGGQGQGGDRRRCGLCGEPVEMPERQHKLEDKREQRQPRAVFDVFPEPVHADKVVPHRLPCRGQPMLQYNIAGESRPCQFRRGICRAES